EDAGAAIAVPVARGEIGAGDQRLGVERVAARPAGRELLRLAHPAGRRVQREQRRRLVAAVGRRLGRGLGGGQLGRLGGGERVAGDERGLAVEDAAHRHHVVRPATGPAPRLVGRGTARRPVGLLLLALVAVATERIPLLGGARRRRG